MLNPQTFTFLRKEKQKEQDIGKIITLQIIRFPESFDITQLNK